MKFLTSIFTAITIADSVRAQQTTYSLASLDSTQILGLPSACDSLYHSVLVNCASADFLPSNACSAGCKSSLLSVQTEVESSCTGATIPATSILNFFVQGNGVNEVCTVQKASQGTPTTFMMSVMPMKTSAVVNSDASATGSAATVSPTANLAGIQTSMGITGADTTRALPKGTVIAVVVAVTVVVSILAVVGVVLFRKNYLNTEPPKK
jgi:hypothetical protein